MWGVGFEFKKKENLMNITITIHHLFRYLYGGILFLFICAWIPDNLLHRVFNIAKDLGGGVFSLSVGALIYVIYRASIAECMWYICAWLHLPFNRKLMLYIYVMLKDVVYLRHQN